MVKLVGVKLFILFKWKVVENILNGKYGDEKVFLIIKMIEDMGVLIDVGVLL